MTAIVDSLFAPNFAIHANGDREGFEPRYVEWDRMAPGRQIVDHGPVWWTDGHTPKVRRPGMQITLLLEPEQLHPENYAAVGNAVEDGFIDHIFTHQPQHFEGAPEITHLYPLGGTRIHESDWRLHEKSRSISCIASPKRGLPGHALRHEAIAALGSHVDAYGPDYDQATVRSKLNGLAPYRFSIVTECVDTGVMLSEHLLDCFLTGTIPIYWGNASAVEVWGFSRRGVWYVNDLESIKSAVYVIEAMNPEMMYEERLQAVRYNFERAHEYTCPEDWLFRHYQELF